MCEYFAMEKRPEADYPSEKQRNRHRENINDYQFDNGMNRLAMMIRIGFE